jgi:hypothetical protein
MLTGRRPVRHRPVKGSVSHELHPVPVKLGSDAGQPFRIIVAAMRHRISDCLWTVSDAAN